ncbi:hypothetical protein [Mesorhizobium sp. SP-1A]|uniref:hypothetical protein n=1 Tax=Mesorhizobium sp. SP-1A TaxID=3077840 RepID=UPI0028F6C290|nr:hypothetical protein [Mesorhizobium sp. SP-1A]
MIAAGHETTGAPAGHGSAPIEWLGLAAAPTFAIMALGAAVLAGPDICSAAQGMFSLGGMVPMYLLMSLFHSGPWLRLAQRQFHRGRL